MSLSPNQNVSSSESTVPLAMAEDLEENRNNSGKEDIELGNAQDLNDNQKPQAGAEDEVDKSSVYSLYMDKDFRYYFQHPYFRLFIAYLVTFCNFLIYAEDPVAHSEKECFIPVVGQCFSFVFTKYPPNGYAALKVIMWVTAVLLGLVIGKQLVHQLIFNKLFKLKMFHNDHGSWMVMFFTTILLLFIFSWLYNGLLTLAGVPHYHVSSLMGIKNQWFMKAAACGTWCGDFFTAWMVTDIMLQEKLYPQWGKRARKWWNTGHNRVYLFWIVTVSMSLVVVTVIGTDWIRWDTLNRDFLPSNEVMRAFLASFILVMDLLIVMQDWDFPHFISAFDLKLPGLTTGHLRFHFDLPDWLQKDVYIIHITGKWFNYGIIFFVMILDLNMWKNQIFYEPYDYGQYVNHKHKVCTVRDEYSLVHYNKSQLTFEYRNSTISPETNATYFSNDYVMNSQWEGFSLPVKGMAFIPTLLAFVCFGIMIWYFGRWKPTTKDRYGGRMKKRHKRNRWSRMWQRISKIRRRPPEYTQNSTLGSDSSSPPAQEMEGGERGEGGEGEAVREGGASVANPAIVNVANQAMRQTKQDKVRAQKSQDTSI